MVLYTDSNGATLHRNTYDEYGVPSTSNGGRFQYTGQVWLEELGMYYYKARIYSPRLGRFLQTDPIDYEDNVNLYAYVANDPVNGVDPTGLETVTSCQGVSATCDQGVGGQTFTGNTPEEAMRNAQMAASNVNSTLTGNTGHEWGNVLETNPDGSVTASVSVSDGSDSNVDIGLEEIRNGTDNPTGDNHAHPTPPPGFSRAPNLSTTDVDSADILATKLGAYNRAIVDGATGDVVSYDGRAGSMLPQTNGAWLRSPSSSTITQALRIGRVAPVPYHKP